MRSRRRQSLTVPGLCLALGLLGAPGAWAQVLRGTVTDSATQRPLEGALVTMVGTNQRATTRADGEYSFAAVAPGTVSLRVQRIGFEPVTRTVSVADSGETIVDFVLAPRLVQLEEIVSWGYGTEAREDLTAAVSSVGGDAVAGEPVASVDAALLGKAAGVQVIQNAGTPGNGVSVRIRGSASLSASNQPLYVVDGVPMTSERVGQLDFGGQDINGTTGLAMTDIERIDVLKDAAATSIYGSRGSNGVVIITTKRGDAGPARVNFNVSTGVQSLPKQLSMMNSTQYLTYMNEAAARDGYGTDYFGVVGVDDAINTNWQDAVFRTAPVSNIDAAVSGGSDRLRYRVSGNYFDQDGITIGSGYRRLSGRVNLDFGVSDKVTFSAGLAVSGDNNKRITSDNTTLGAIPNAIGEQPNIPVRLSDGSFSSPADGLRYPNPVAIGRFNTANARASRVLGNFEARGQLTSALTVSGRVGVDFLSLHETRFNSQLVLGSDAERGDGIATDAFNAENRYVFDGFIGYDRRWADQHSLNLTTGTSLELARSSWNYVRGEGMGDPRFNQVGNAAVITGWDGGFAESNLVSYFGRANYAFRERYLLGASFRFDGSSRFGPNTKWGFFPSISAGWVLSDEPFLQGSRLFDQLKLRGSYGLTGNQAVGSYPWQGTACTANYGPVSGLAPCSISNPDLKWERTAQLDLGFDATMLNGRLALTGDWYHKKTNDLLVSRPITTTSGQSTVISNVGNLKNNGVELQLTAQVLRPRSGGSLGWTSTLNLAHNRNEVTKLYGNQPFSAGFSDANRVEVGHPLGEFHLFKFVGVDPQTGDALYRTAAGGVTTNPSDEDRFFVGTPWPSLTGGLTNTLTWKSVDLSFLFQWSTGAQVYNAVRLYANDGGYYSDNKLSRALNRWQNPGDITDEPRASYDGTSGARLPSSRFVENADYLRLLDVTLGIQLPERLAGSIGFTKARFYITGHNLFTITGYSGYFPDVNASGSTANLDLGTDFYTYPLARTFSVGVQAGW